MHTFPQLVTSDWIYGFVMKRFSAALHLPEFPRDVFMLTSSCCNALHAHTSGYSATQLMNQPINEKSIFWVTHSHTFEPQNREAWISGMIYIYIFIYLYIYIDMCIYREIALWICTYVNIYIYVYMCILPVYIYICEYRCIHINI